jgi:hypothetical protein
MRAEPSSRRAAASDSGVRHPRAAAYFALAATLSGMAGISTLSSPPSSSQACQSAWAEWLGQSQRFSSLLSARLLVVRVIADHRPVSRARSLARWVDGSAFREGTRPQRAVSWVFGLAVIGAALELDRVLFRVLFDSDYLRWYLANGSLIALAFGVFTVAWADLNRMTGLISANPYSYVAATGMLSVLPLHAGTALIMTPDALERRKRRIKAELERAATPDTAAAASFEERARQQLIAYQARKQLDALAAEEQKTSEDVEPDEPAYLPEGLGAVDIALGMLFTPALQLVFFAWMLVAAPSQYFVNLVAGAPSRRALASPLRAFYRVTETRIQIGHAEKRVALPEDVTESTFSGSPVTVATVLSAALLFVASKLILG